MGNTEKVWNRSFIFTVAGMRVRAFLYFLALGNSQVKKKFLTCLNFPWTIFFSLSFKNTCFSTCKICICFTYVKFSVFVPLICMFSCGASPVLPSFSSNFLEGKYQLCLVYFALCSTYIHRVFNSMLVVIKNIKP